MKKIVSFPFFCWLATTQVWAQQPDFPQTMPPNTVYGRLGIGRGPGQAIPFPVLAADLGIQKGQVTLVGADPTGLLDSSLAIRAALLGGGIDLWFPPGTYLINTCLIIPSNVRLQAIPGTVTLHIPHNINMAGCTNFGGAHAFQNADGGSNITIDGLILQGDGNLQTVPTGIIFDNMTGLRITNSVIQGFGNGTVYNQGIVMFTITGFWLENTTFSGNSGDGFAIGGGVSTFFVSNNKFLNNGDYGFASIGGSNGTVVGNTSNGNTNIGLGFDASDHVAITGNSTSGNATGVGILTVSGANSYISVSSNVSKGDATAFLMSTCILGCSMVVNSASAFTSFGINLVGVQNANVSGNTLIAPVGAGVICIVSEALAGETTQNNVIASNVTNGCGYGIRELTSGGGTMGSETIANNVATGASIANFSTINPNVFSNGGVVTWDFTGAAGQLPIFQNLNNTAAAIFYNFGGTTNQRKWAWTPLGTSLLLQGFNDANGFASSIASFDFAGTIAFPNLATSNPGGTVKAVCWGSTAGYLWTNSGSTCSATTISQTGFVATAAAPTVSAGQVGYGGTTVAAGSGTCPSGTVGGQTVAGCVVVNIAGTNKNVPYF